MDGLLSGRPLPACSRPHSLIDNIKNWRSEQASDSDHVMRWKRALAALGHGSHANPMTLDEAKDMADQYTASRWQPVVDALEKLAGG